MPGSELNTDRLIGTLIERTEQMGRELHSIGMKLDAMSASHNNRVSLIETRVTSLEMRAAERQGGSKMASWMLGIAAMIGGLVATFVGHAISLFRGV